MFQLKRAYEAPSEADGLRVLVDRRWPCNVFKARAEIDLWLKDIAPSEELTDWFHRDPAKWEEFRRRYWEELRHKPDQVNLLLEKSRHGLVTLVYRAKDTEQNNAVALKEYL